MTHAEQNAALCQWLGIEPKREWVVGYAPRDGEYGSIAMTFTPDCGFLDSSEKTARDWLRKKQDANPDGSLYSGYEAWEWVKYPDLSTWDGMRLLLESVKRKGFVVCLEDDVKQATAALLVPFDETQQYIKQAASLPEALFAAAVKAMEASQ